MSVGIRRANTDARVLPWIETRNNREGCRGVERRTPAEHPVPCRSDARAPACVHRVGRSYDHGHPHGRVWQSIIRCARRERRWRLGRRIPAVPAAIRQLDAIRLRGGRSDGATEGDANNCHRKEDEKNDRGAPHRHLSAVLSPWNDSSILAELPPPVGGFLPQRARIVNSKSDESVNSRLNRLHTFETRLHYAPGRGL